MKKFSNIGLSDDINNYSNDQLKSSNDIYEIESIIDIFNDPDDISENFIGVNADLSNKEIKRGDTVYITAMVRKKGQSFNSPSVQSVLKVRIVDIYNGLSYLNKVIN